MQESGGGRSGVSANAAVIVSEAKDLWSCRQFRHSWQSAWVLRFAQDDNAFVEH